MYVSGQTLDLADGRRAWVPVEPMLRKALDTARMTVRSVLTYPVLDVDGDWVAPDGGDWTPHERDVDCRVNLEHDPAAVIAYARESLADPGAPHAVEMKALDLGKHGTWTLPVGTSYFDPASRLSTQAFRLVEDDTLPGVSIEFKPAADAYRGGRLVKAVEPLPGVSPVNNRPSCKWNLWLGYGWAHCARPVNPGALTVKAAPAPDAVRRLLDVRRVGSEPAHPLILKALSKYAAPRAAVARSGWEAPMPDYGIRRKAADADVTLSAYDVAGAELDGPGGEGEDLKPSVAAHYDLAQALLDAVEQARETLAKSEHLAARKWLARELANVEKMAEKVKGQGDKLDAELSSFDDQLGGTEEPDDADAEMADDADMDAEMDAAPEADAEAGDLFADADMGEPDGDEMLPPEMGDMDGDEAADDALPDMPDVADAGDAEAPESGDEDEDPADMETDEEGVLKAIPPAYYERLRKAAGVRRVTKAQLDAAPPAAPADHAGPIDPALARAQARAERVFRRHGII